MDDVEEHRLEIECVDDLKNAMLAFRPDVVYHLAAVVDTATTPDVLALYRANTIGTAALLVAARRVESVRRVMIASSSHAYGRTAPSDQPVAENAPLRPVTPYGASKAAGEVIALQWARETGIDVVITRAFQHTGPGHVGPYALADWATRLAAGEQTLLVGDLDIIRDYLDVRDVAAAYQAVVESGRAGSVYNVGSGSPLSMRSALGGLISAFGKDVEVAVDPSRFRMNDQPALVADVTRITADTGWRPSRPMTQTLADLADWCRGRSGLATGS